MTSSEARPNVLTQKVKTLKTEGNFVNSYRFCCAALTLLLLVVLLLLVAMADLLLSTFQRVPKPENMDAIVDEMQIHVTGLGSFNFSQNVHVPDKIVEPSNVKDYITIEGFVNLRLLLGNPWKQRMKLGKIEGTAWLGDGDLATGTHLADVNLIGIEAIEPKQSAEHMVSVTFRANLYDAVFAGADVVKLVVSSTPQKLGVTVDFKFRDVWLDLFFNKRWTIGFDVRGTFYINNNLGLETLGLCANILNTKSDVYRPFSACWDYWANACAPCVKCSDTFSADGQQYHCEPATQAECDMAQTCRQRQNGATRNQLGETDVIGTSCSQSHYVRRLEDVTRRVRKPNANMTSSDGHPSFPPPLLHRRAAKSNEELTANDRASAARRQLKTEHNDQARATYFAYYYEDVAEYYSFSGCKADAEREWWTWFSQKLEEEISKDLISGIKQGKLPFMPSNPSGTLFYQFFLPMILAIAFLFTVSFGICCRVFGVHAYYLYQERRRARKKEQDQKYMNRLEQEHPEFHKRQGFASHSEVHQRHEPNSHAELHQRHAPNSHSEFFPRHVPNSRSEVYSRHAPHCYPEFFSMPGPSSAL